MRTLAIVAALVIGSPAKAIVGGAPPATDAAAKAVVTLVGARGNVCSGALIAPRIVLTAAHCVAGGPPGEFRLVSYDAARQPTLLAIRAVATHPQFSMQAMLAHRASADVALLQLAEPMPSATTAPLGTPLQPLAAGRAFRIIGIGVTVRGDGRSSGTVRGADLVATGKPGTLQLRLVDPRANNVHAGLGACTGDSGAPVFEAQDGRDTVVGIVSWSTGPANAAGCGGLTGATPLTLYAPWIAATMRAWGAAP